MEDSDVLRGDVLTPDPAGRFHLVGEAIQAPGVCWVTKTEKGPFIDTGLSIAFGEFGRLYLSVEVVREMALVAGVIGGELSVPAQMRSQENYQRGYDLATKENISGNLRELVDRLVGVVDRLDGVPYFGDTEASPMVAVENASEPSVDDEAEPAVFVTVRDTEPVDAEGADEATEDSGRSDRQSDGPSDDDRPVSLPSNTSDVNPFRI